jgi:Ser/Thr protein kinase RdoA (MazF antagonist)
MPEHQLIAAYQRLLNLHDTTFTHIDHDDALVATVYKVTKQEGAHFILKVCERPKDYLREVHFLEHFANKMPVPKIIEAIPPSNEIPGAILMEYFPGALLQNTDITEGLAYDIGSTLAKVHLNRVTDYGDPITPETLSTDPRVYFTLKYDEGLDECRLHLPQTLMDKCRRFYDENIDLLTKVDGPCIVHRDFRPGNIIIHHGKLKGIIDWAGARHSFAEEDFCSLEHGEWPEESRESFLAGYSSVRSVPNYENLMPFLRVNKAIASIGFTLKTGTWNGKSKKLYQLNRNFLDNFFNLVM